MTTSRASRCGPRGSARGGSSSGVTDGTVGNTSVYDTQEHECFRLGSAMMAAVADHPQLPARIRAMRLGLAGLTALLSVNLWTGAPLFAIWVGSRVQGRSGTGL